MKRATDIIATAAIGFILPGAAITIATDWCLRSILYV
jgi:hypothetical protein